MARSAGSQPKTASHVPPVVVRGPERKVRLIEATVRVLLRDGLDGVSHRSVSEEAGLPIAATTYYFASLNTLISETFHALYAAHLSASTVDLQPGAAGDPVEDLVDAFFRTVGEKREATQVLYELHLLAGRRPELRGYATISWDRAVDEIAQYLGLSYSAAVALEALIDGYTIAALSIGRIPDRDHLRKVYRAVVAADRAEIP